MGSTLAAIVIGYLPGALIFRAPTDGRSARARLPAEERAFWSIVLSVVVSSSIALLLAAISQYTFTRLLILDVVISAGIAAWSRGNLRLPVGAPRLGLTAVPPALLVALGLWLYSPPAEYVVGGKDPGVYLNQGIQVAQRGSLVINDAVVAAVPPLARDLFFPPRGDPTYHGLRFMGFFVVNPETGTVVGQFPHLYPIWVAFGYGLDGVSGARRVVGGCAILGLVAVYFAGAWLLGRAAAIAGTVLLALNVAEVWFGRYSNSELALQALIFAGLLALARSDEHRGGLFPILAATLIGLALFARLEAVLMLVAIAAAAVLRALDGRPLPRLFLAVLGVWVALAALYYVTVMRPYAQVLVGFLRNLAPWRLMIAGLVVALVIALIRAGQRPSIASRIHRWLPTVIVAGAVSTAAYAYFLRAPGGALAPHDALALRTFAEYYLSPYGLAAALAGFALLVRLAFWRHPALFLTIVVFAGFFFYKVRVVPEHFWMARRFLPVILPGALLMVGAVACFALVPGAMRLAARTRLVSLALGAVLVSALGSQFWRASRPLLAHVEYADAIARLEHLAARFGDDELVLVESRQASDLHVLALPLAYTYGRNVLVLDSRQPDKDQFLQFLAWARTRYRNVFFLGGGGTDLVSPRIAAQPILGERFQLPEYESPLNAYPRAVRYKAFDFGIYRFVPPGVRETLFALDIGSMDDLHTMRFHAKERHGASGLTFRWSRDVSYITVLPPARPRIITLWLSAGVRPKIAPPARVSLYLDDHLLGSVTVDDAFRPYRFDIPQDLAASLSAGETTGQVKIVTSTWDPLRALGVPDDRDLGVMVDRIEVR